MKHYKSLTPKATILWSNSSAVSKFDLGPLSKSALRSSVRTTDRWTDSSGRKCFKGNKHLRGTQTLAYNCSCLALLCSSSEATSRVQLRTYTVQFARKIIQTTPLLVMSQTKDWVEVSCTNYHSYLLQNSALASICPIEATQVDELQSIESLFNGLSYDDLWDDAGVRSAIRYVRGSKALRLPAELRPLVPRSL